MTLKERLERLIFFPEKGIVDIIDQDDALELLKLYEARTGILITLPWKRGELYYEAFIMKLMEFEMGIEGFEYEELDKEELNKDNKTYAV